MSSDAGLAALLLGPEAAQQLYSVSLPTIDAQIRTISPETSPFLQRLREALTHCCVKVGVEATFKHLLVPVAVGQYLVEEGQPKKLKLAPADTEDETLCYDDCLESRESFAITEETKQKAVRLYQKNIRVTYIAELFGVESPKLVHSWGNWSKRSQAEMEGNLQRRAQIQTLLAQGETPKAICQELKIKPKNYREFLGLASGPAYSREAYEKVMQQIQLVKVKNTVSKTSGVSVYIINKWLEGKDVPEPDAIMDDAEGTRDIKRLAIETFYDSGSAVAAANAVKRPPVMVKKWVMEFQRNVDKKYSRGRDKNADVAGN